MQVLGDEQLRPIARELAEDGANVTTRWTVPEKNVRANLRVRARAEALGDRGILEALEKAT